MVVRNSRQRLKDDWEEHRQTERNVRPERAKRSANGDSDVFLLSFFCVDKASDENKWRSVVAVRRVFCIFFPVNG